MHKTEGRMAMKKRYDVSRLAECGSYSDRDLRTAFRVAQGMASYYGEEISLRELTWDDGGRISMRTALVSPEGTYRYI